MSSRAIVPGQGHSLLRFWRDRQVVDRVPIVAFFVDFEDEGDFPLDARAATGDMLFNTQHYIHTATLLPDGRVVDLDGEYNDEEVWLKHCKTRFPLQSQPPKGHTMNARTYEGSIHNRVVIRQQNGIVEYFVIAADGAVLREGTVPNEATVVVDTNV